MNSRLLLLEHDSQSDPTSLAGFLNSDRGFDCERHTWSSFPLEQLRRSSARLIVAVAPPEPTPCLNLLSWLRTNPVAMSTLAVLPSNPSPDCWDLTSQTADDFVFYPVRHEELHCRLTRLLGERKDGNGAQECKRIERSNMPQLLGDDPAFLEVIERIPAVASMGAPVLLLGETGTGKELCALAVHRLSSRSAGPFVPVECSAIPENLIENELFGHVRGAYTDAHNDQRGLVAMAEGGTLFLDEVNSLPLPAQGKLLRFLQEGTYRPIGSQKFTRANIRLVAASNRDLGECIRDNQFRADLYFRLNVLPLRLPPLRERPADIATLAQHFLTSICKSAARPTKSFSHSAMRVLLTYRWPGNVRELFNVTQRAVAFSPGGLILPSHLLLGAPSAEPGPTNGQFREERSRVVGEFERYYIEAVLRKHQGNVTHAAQEAGKDRRVFGRLIKKYRINPHQV
jgi:DNA-binding NtrC family response regulator